MPETTETSTTAAQANPNAAVSQTVASAVASQQTSTAESTTNASNASKTVQDDKASTSVASILESPDKGSSKVPADGQKTDEKKDDKQEGSSTAITPDKYEYKLPENYKLEGDLRKSVDAFVSEAKLTPELAQKGVDFFVKQQQATAEAAKAANEAFFASETRSLETDKTFGGQNYQETRALVNKGYQALREELKAFPAEQKALDEMMITNKLANLRPIALALRGFANTYLREARMVQTDNTAAPQKTTPFKTGRGFELTSAVGSVFGQ